MNPDEPPADSGADEDVVVLGKELAKAAEAERQWKERRAAGESPLPQGEYDFWQGQYSLVNPAPCRLDAELREVCRRYARSEPDERCRIRDSISMDGFYTLIAFAKRSAVFALRDGTAETAGDGLTAVAMIERERVDFRDILMCLALLYHVADRVGGDPDRMLQAAAALSEPGVGELLADFINQSPSYRDLRSSWGYDEIETKDGLGFVGWGFRPYNPTVDLKSLSLDLCDLLAQDRYQPDNIEVATDLPEVWLKGGDEAELKSVLTRINGAASISASLRPGEHPEHDSQQFTVFLAETDDAADAGPFLRLANDYATPHHSRLGLAAGNLFCLIVARSFMEGVESFESQVSLLRLSDGFTAVLNRYANENNDRGP